MTLLPKDPRRQLVRLTLAHACALGFVSSALAQAVNPPPAAPGNTAPKVQPNATPPSAVPDSPDDETIVLSPFTVQSSSQDIGYYASNTLAGSRLNSKIGDLAAPISIITKQQLEDTGARDLNDVFLYEANTEGSLNYTKIRVDRGGLKDEIGGTATNGIGAQTSTTANRIRGLTNVDITWNYYSAIARIRGDSYNADSFEISRGPNSILAGLGSPAGILNQSIGTGRINVNSNEVNMAVGSHGSYRASLALNRTLIRDRLSIYLAALYDDREFEREPSFDRSRRQTAGFTFKPFKKTTIKGFIENYRNESQTPNQLTPRDGITPWLAAGRPTWDPLTRMVTFLDTGVTRGPYTNQNSELVPQSAITPGNLVRISGDTVLTDRRSSQFIPGLGFVNLGRPVRMINPDGSFFWTQAQATTFNIYAHPTIANQALTGAHVTGTLSGTGVFTPPTLGVGAGSPYDVWSRRLTSSALAPAPITYDLIGGTSYVAPSINNKALYDWEKINIQAVNHGEQRATTYNLEFEQQLLPNLFFSTGWFRQDLDSLENYPLSQLAPTTVLIDTNKNLPNGQANPNYLRPFVDIQDPDTAQTPETREIYRAMLAYDLDFTKRDGFLRWLGRHRILAFAQHQEEISTSYRYRFSFSDPSDPRFLRSEVALPFAGAAGGVTPRSAQVGFRYSGNANTSRHAWYVGGPNGVVTAAPADVGNPAIGTTQSSTITAYNYQTGAWEQAPVTYGAELFDAGGGYSRAQRLINTTNLTAQSYFLDERIVTTLGIRQDKWKGRQNTTGTDEYGNVLGANGDQVNAFLYPAGTWRLNENLGILERWGRAEFLEDKTGSAGIVVKPFTWFSVHANKSDNFNPPAAAQVDFFRQKLPTPTGESKDYGFTFNLLDNKLIARVTFFETKFNGDRSNGSIGTVAGRVPRMDTANLKGWAEAVVRIRSNIPGRPEADRPQLNAPNGPTPTNTWTDAGQAGNQLSANQIAIVDSMLGGLTSTWPDGTSFAGTQNAQAEGAEVEIIYNPTPNWNIKLAGGKQETTYSEIFPEYDRWVAARMPVWQAAAAPDLAAIYTQPDGKQFSLQRFYSGYGFGETNIATRQNGANPEDWLNNVVNAELANARILQGAAPYGQRKYRANLISNYLFTSGFLKNFGVGGAIRWEDKAVIGYRGKMDSRGLWTGADPERPMYDTDFGVDRFWDLTHFDMWLSYRFKLWNDKVRTKIQLNVTDMFQNGRLSPVFVNYDGSPTGYRIVDSRRWQLSAKFEF
jgi:hypothetical protein